MPSVPLTLTAAADIYVFVSGRDIAEQQPAISATIASRVMRPSFSCIEGASICAARGLPAAGTGIQSCWPRPTTPALRPAARLCWV
eukprot:5661195-Prymnesium_polylepis.1